MSAKTNKDDGRLTTAKNKRDTSISNIARIKELLINANRQLHGEYIDIDKISVNSFDGFKKGNEYVVFLQNKKNQEIWLLESIDIQNKKMRFKSHPTLENNPDYVWLGKFYDNEPVKQNLRFDRSDTDVRTHGYNPKNIYLDLTAFAEDSKNKINNSKYVKNLRDSVKENGTHTRNNTGGRKKNNKNKNKTKKRKYVKN